MVSERGRRAWVLGQGQAATGTDTHSASCGQQRAGQSARTRRPRPQNVPRPRLLGTFCFLSPETAFLKAGVAKHTLDQPAPGASEEAPPSGGQGGGPQGCWVELLATWGLLGIKDLGAEQPARPACAWAGPRRSPSSASRELGPGCLGLITTRPGTARMPRQPKVRGSGVRGGALGEAGFSVP